MLRLLNHLNNLVVSALTGGLLHLQYTFAFLYYGPGIDCAAGVFGHRDGLAGEGRLVDSDFTLQHQAVQRNDAAGADDYGIPRLDPGDGNQNFALRCAQPDTVHVEGHGPGEIIHRLFPGPFLQQFAHFQQKHHHPGGAEISAAGRNRDGQRVQKLHLDGSVQEAAESPPDKRDHMPENTGDPQRGREKQGAGCFAKNFAHQLFLKFPVQCPAAMGGH